MKTSILALVLMALVVNSLEAQQTTAQTQAAQVTQASVPAPTPYAIVNQDANSRVWQRQEYEAGPNGEVVTNTHSYTELQTGLNFKDSAGNWQPSEEEIAIQPDGTAAALFGQHKLYFPANINDGRIEMVTPDGRQIYSQPLELSYFDGTNAVVLAELTNSAGILVGSNQIVYPKAFNGLSASILYTYTRGGLEQDVILHQQPFTPESYGLNPATARLQVVTEFFNAPSPTLANNTLPQQAGITLTDQSIGFGTMQMVPGKAFLLGQAETEPGAMVAKSWETLDGRQFLVEEVPVNAIVEGLTSLPLTALNRGSSKSKDLASKHFVLPRHSLQGKPSSAKMIANGRMPEKGFVLDYQTINISLTNFTFRGDTTYYISGGVNLYGTTVIEGGTVLKYTNSAYASLFPLGLVVCKTSPYRPAIFTAKDDDSVGDSIAGSTGNPTGYYGNPQLEFNGEVAGFYLHDLRFCYADIAVQLVWSNPYTNTISNCQIGHVGNAIFCYNIFTAPTLVAENMLIYQAQSNAFSIYGGTCSAQYCTFNQANSVLSSGGGATVQIANSLIVGVTNSGSSFTSINNATNNSGNVFQVMGAGNYYLSSDSPYHNIGMTNIDPALLAELRQKTTWSPLILSNITISASTTLSPQAQRDNSGALDLGYHYDPIDYLVEQCWVTNCTLTIADGVVAACYDDSGFIITDGSSIKSTGSAVNHNVLTSYQTVQEQPMVISMTSGYGPDDTLDVSAYHLVVAPTGQFDFTTFTCLANGGYSIYSFDPTGVYTNLIIQNSEFWGGNSYICGWIGDSIVCDNSLFVRTVLYSAEAHACTVCFTNNLVYGASSVEFRDPAGLRLFAFNNDFDSCTITANSLCTNGYDAYLGCSGQIQPTNSSDIFNTIGLNYQTSFLGTFYQPTNSPLIQKGSITANMVGLYHFTTQTNQVPETNAIVDIGYHYVATDTNGIPLDSNGDGIPDYIEDANGNGIVDSGEIGWNLTNDLGLQVIIIEPR